MKQTMSLSKIILFTLLCMLPVTSIHARKKKQKAQKTAVQQTQDMALAKKTLNTMNYEELKKAKNELIAAGYKDRATKYLQKMLALATDVHDIADIMLELADLYFETGKLEKAEFLYQEFGRLYPGNKHVEYALYRAILCSFYSILDTDRDQTKTKETIARGQDFLTRSAVFREYSKDVEEIVKKCNEHLFKSELNIARFYGNQGKIAAANTRLAALEKEFDGKIANLKPRLLIAECECAQWNKDVATFERKSAELAQKFPDYTSEKTTKLAKLSQPTPQKRTEKRDFVTKF